MSFLEGFTGNITKRISDTLGIPKTQPTQPVQPPVEVPSVGTYLTTKGSWNLQRADKSVKRQSIPFLFEIQEAGVPVWSAVLPINPESYRMTYQPRANLTLTQGGAFEDNIGIAPPKINISGVFGLVGTKNKIDGKIIGAKGYSLDGKEATGWEIYKNIESSLLQMYERYGRYRLDAEENSGKDLISTGKEPKLCFFNFSDYEFWEVQINQFILNRNTQRRFLYQYDIQMTCLKRIKETSQISAVAKIWNAKLKTLADCTSAADKIGAWDSLMKSGGSFANNLQSGNVMGAIKDVQSGVSTLKSTMRTISTSVADFKNGVTDLVHAPLALVKSAKETADSVMRSSRSITNLPHEFVNDMRQTQRILNSYTTKPNLFKK